MGKFRKLSIVLLLAFVLLCCCAVSVFAEPYTVTVQFQDYYKQPHQYEGSDYQMFVYLEIKDKPAEGVELDDLPRKGWAVSEGFNPNSASDGKFTFTFENFGSINPDGNTPETPDNTITYNQNQYAVSRIRLYTGYLKPTYHNVREKINSGESRPNDVIQNYRITPQIGPTSGEINLQHWGDSFLDISINLDPKVTTQISDSEGYWIRVKLEHTSGSNTYYAVPLYTDDTNSGENPLNIRVEGEVWRTENGQITNEKFTAGEPYVTVQIAKAPAAASVEDVVKQTNGVIVLGKGSIVKDYKVNYPTGYPDGRMEINNTNTVIDNTNFTTTCSYEINLIKNDMVEDSALTPEDVLGDAANFGIVAERYDQFGHSETNFAVKYFFDNSNIDVDGSGDTPVPFYVADITKTARDGTVNNSPQIFILSQGTTVPADIYATSVDTTPITKHDDGLIDYGKIRIKTESANVYPTEKSEIENYVDSLINYGKNKSAELASKVHIAPVYDGVDYVVDTTGYPDGTTIYINADGILKSIGQGGWRINKHPDQTIVFNITKETNGYTVQDHKKNQDKDALRIGEFYVNPNDGGEVVQSTTVAMNDDPVKNQRVDDVILSHIFFNVTSAEYVDLVNSTGLFLLPNATQVTQDNGAGWILAEGTVDSHAEWHFYRHTRNYVAKGGLQLKTKKTIVNGSGNPVQFEDKKFEFELYELDADGNIIPTLDKNNQYVEKPVETEQADNTGLIDFHSFAYNEQNVPSNTTRIFYYKIVEVIPDEAENENSIPYAYATDEQKAAGGFVKDGIRYDAEPILVKVTATNTPPSEPETESVITLELAINNGENWDTVSPASEAKPPVFNLENTKVFTNTKTDSKTGSLALKGKKTVNNSVGRTDQTERHYTFSLCYAGLSGNDCIESSVQIGGIDVKDGETEEFNFTGPMLEYDQTKLEELLNSTPAKATVDNSGKIWTIRYILSEDAFTNSANQKWIKIDTNKILITVTITDDDSGTLQCNADKGINSINFINTVRNNFSITLDASKELTGRNLDGNDKWTFKVEPFGENASDAPLPDGCTVITSNGSRYCTKQNDIAEIKFGNFTFTPEHLGSVNTNNGERIYSYHVQEISTDTPSTQSSSVITDDEQKNFYVKVSLNGDALQAAVYSDEACTESMDITGDDTDIKFTNQYHDNGSAILSVTKSMDYWPSETESYTFKLKAADTVSNDKLKTKTGYNSEDHSVTISVNKPSSGSITGSFPAITFSEADFVTDTAPHHWNEFNYTITEVSPENLQGVTYSTDSYNVKITLADTGHDGKIVPTVQVKKNNEGNWTTLNSADNQNFTVLFGNGPTFTNSYDASGSLQFSGKKTLENWDQERTFQFNLTYNDSATPVTSNPFQTVTVPKAEGSSAANQETAFNFPVITFTNFQSLNDLVSQFANVSGNKPVTQTNTNPKTWQIEYLLTEADVTDNVIKQDKTEYLITATIKDNGNGTLDCSYKTNQTGDTVDPQISFTNHVIQDIEIPISAKKGLNNGTLTNQKWNFTLTGDGPMPASCSSPCVKTNNGEKIDFGSIKFTAANLNNTDPTDKQKEKIYTYTITEEKITSGTDASPANVNIDPQPTKTFTVTVSLNEQTKDMNAVVKVGNDIVGKNASGKYEVSTFTNTLVNDNEIHFTITKKLIDNNNKEVTTWPSNAEFTLTLEGGDGENGNGTQKLQGLTGLTQTVNGSNHTISGFPTISFSNTDVNQDFVFRVTETNTGTSGGIEFLNDYPTLTIRPVLDSGQIKLQQKTSEGQYTDIEDNTLAFGDYINKYNASGTVTLAAKKSMKYGYWPKGATFSFSITDAASPAGLENVPKKTEGFAYVTATENDPVADFEQIHFDQQDIGKTFYFTISEKTDQLDTNVFTPPSVVSYTVSVLVGTNSDGSLKFTVKDAAGKTIDPESSSNLFIAGDFVNEYNAEGKIKLKARKLIWDANGYLKDNETHEFHFILKHKVGTNEVDTILDESITGSVEISVYSTDGKPRINNFEMSEITYNLKLLNDLTTNNPALAIRVPNTEKPTWLIEYVIEEYSEANKTESNADIDLDHLHRPVTVQVVDNGDGTLICTQVTCTADGICTEASDDTYPLFENHEILEGSVIIKATKVLDGRDLTPNDKWTFILIADSNNPSDLMPERCPNPCTTENNQGTIKFDPIHFTPDLLWNADKQEYEEKTYKYTLIESRDITYPGITNDNKGSRSITITASYDQMNGKVIVNADPDVINFSDEIKFINTYEASGKVKLKVTKAMNPDSLWPKGGSFTFTIKEEDTSSIYTGAGSISVNDPQNPWALFSDINFDQSHLGPDKEYIFTIKETADTITCAGPNECINYDPAVYTVTLDPQPSGKNIRPTVTIIKNNDSSTARTFTPDENDEGVYVIPVSVDNSGVTFTNNYQPEGSASLSITKNLQGADWPEENGVKKVLKFTLVPKNGAPIPEDHITEKELRDPGTVTFGEIKFPYTADTVFGSTAYQYEILESTNFGDGWTVSPSRITATVRIVKDNGDGTLVTDVSYDPNDTPFTNSYETKGSLVLSAEKAFNRWDMVDSFTFKLETDYKDYVDQKTVRKDSPVAEFKQIDFTKFDDGKERTFTISEVMPNPPIDGVIYAKPIVISITPKDNGDGTMTLYSSGKELPKDDNGVYKLNVGTLTNTYHSAGAGVIQVAKVLEGREWNNDDTYTFTLEAVDGAPMPGKTSVTITKKTAGQTDAFEEIPFSEPGTYKYIVKETECSVKGVTCEKTDKTVTFKVERNEKGEIVAAADSNLIQDVSFTNTYNAEGKLNLKSSKRIENNDDTFEKHLLPFVLYHKYDGKNDYPDGKPVIERIVEVEDGTLTDFDYPIYYSVDEVPGSADPSDGKREILKKLVSDGYAKVISTTDDTNTKWEVGYFLTELPAIDHQLKPPTQSFDILVTISDSGTGELKVEKVRVQALNEKGEIVEPFKDISDNDGFAIGPFVNTERKDFFTELLIGTKILEGRDLTAADNGKWRVTISSEDENAPLPQEKTVPIEISEENGVLKGSFAFAPITFKPEHLGKCIPDAEKGYVCGSKDYHYTLTESGNAVGIINGPALKFIIRVSEAEDGHVQADFVDETGNILSADRILAAMTFTNTTRSFTEGDAEIAVEKVFNGEWPDGLGFTFTITPLNEAPMSERSAVTVTKDDPSGSFGKIRITVEDMTDESGAAVTEKSFSYEIREVIPEGADPNGIYQGIQYDTRVRTVTISARIEGDTIIILSPADHVISETFTNRKVEQETPEGPTFHRIETMPRTGFSSLRPSDLKEQPKDLIYRPMAFTLQIPSLDITANIVEVPFADGEYPVEWLGSSAGLLEGYALPGEGQTFITGHNHLNTMEAGPFALLNEMGIGDRIFVVDSEDKMQIFTVYANEKVAETDIRGLERIAGQFNNSLTLITCEDEMESGGYANRRIIACKPVNK